MKSISKRWLQNLKVIVFRQFCQSWFETFFEYCILLGLSADVIYQVCQSFRDIVLLLVWYLKGPYLKDQCMPNWMHSVWNHLYTQLPNKLLNCSYVSVFTFAKASTLKLFHLILHLSNIVKSAMASWLLLHLGSIHICCIADVSVTDINLALNGIYLIT